METAGRRSGRVVFEVLGAAAWLVGAGMAVVISGFGADLPLGSALQAVGFGALPWILASAVLFGFAGRGTRPPGWTLLAVFGSFAVVVAGALLLR